MLEMNQMLKIMVERDASDLHLHVGKPAVMRLHGHGFRPVPWLAATLLGHVAVLLTLGTFFIHVVTANHERRRWSFHQHPLLAERIGGKFSVRLSSISCSSAVGVGLQVPSR